MFMHYLHVSMGAGQMQIEGHRFQCELIEKGGLHCHPDAIQEFSVIKGRYLEGTKFLNWHHPTSL